MNNDKKNHYSIDYYYNDDHMYYIIHIFPSLGKDFVANKLVCLYMMSIATHGQSEGGRLTLTMLWISVNLQGKVEDKDTVS